MSQEKRKLQRKLRNKRKKRLQIALISFILIYIFFRSIPSFFASASKIVQPEPIIIEDKVEGEAVIIKKENLYKADAEGKIQTIKKEGERVSAGSRVANLISLSDTSTLNQELEELEEKIDILAETKKDSDSIKSKGSKSEENITNIINDIQNGIAQGNYENSEALKAKLSIYSTKQKDITGENTLLNQSLDDLKAQHKDIIEQISSNSIGYFSEEAGIVSYKIDGYEESYTLNNKDNYTGSDLKKQTNEENEREDSKSAKIGTPIFKIIDNLEWYMIIKVADYKSIESYEEGDSILLVGENIDKELKGSVQRVKKEKSSSFIQCKFNSDFNNYYDKRFMDVDIIKYKHEGFKIPSRSIVEKDGKQGVYIKSISGIIKFRPVEILKQEDKITYVKAGDKNNNIYIGGSDKAEKTIAVFDEILRNTINIKEGMIIN